MVPSVLIVDDEKHTREGLQQALVDNYDVSVAANADEAANLMDAQPFDVVVTDLRMPGKSGLKVIDKALALPNRPAVLMMTAYGNVEMVLNTLPNFGAPEKLDAVLSVGTYHYHYTRLLGSPNVVAINRKVFDSLKPGGVFLVVDAMAPAGTAAQGAENLNRIDPATVRADVTKAGFVFEGESPILRTTSDTYRTNALATDAGRVDQFVYKFRKPRAAGR